MDKSNLESGPRAGPRKGESRTSGATTPEVCPTYYGGGKNCFGAGQTAQSRKNDNPSENSDTIFLSDMDMEKGPTSFGGITAEGGEELPGDSRKSRNGRVKIVLGGRKGSGGTLTPHGSLDGEMAQSASTSREASVDRGVSRRGTSFEELMGRDWSLNSESESTGTAVKRHLVDFGAAADKAAKAKRGRARVAASRPSTTCADMRDSSEETRDAAFVASLERRMFLKPNGQEVVDVDLAMPGPLDLDPDQMGTEDLRSTAEDSLKEILGMTGRSTNLKGGYANKIRRAAGVVRAVLETLTTRTEAEETRRLKADNLRLKREVANLKEEVRAYRRDFEEAKKEATAQRKSSGPMSSEQLGILESNIARLVGNLVDGRLATLEDRLLPPVTIRPPLAAARKRTAQTTGAVEGAQTARSKSPILGSPQREAPKKPEPAKGARSQRTVEEFPPLPVRPAVNPAPLRTGVKGKGRKEAPSSGSGPSTRSSVGKGVQEPAVTSEQTEATASKEGWSEVVRRKAPKKRPAPQTKVEPPKKAPSKAAKLTLPTSSAVTLTLRPEAAQSGVTYREALTKAQLKIDIKELGIGPLRIKSSATGGRIIEVPGRSSGEKADALANKLSEVLTDVAEVARPVKLTDFKLTGLDDTATSDSIRMAVASEGGCAPELVRVAAIQHGPRGLGFALISCPVLAAKKLLQLGHLVIGWSRVQLHHIGARPRHCFKCQGMGHTATLCPSEKDRRDLCYRCGQPGHKAAACSAEPRCAICSEAGRKANHKMGGRACNPPPVKGKYVGLHPPRPAGGGSVAPEAEMSE